MSVQVSYKKQMLLGIIGLVIILGVLEIVANVWWISAIQCEFEENEIFSEMNTEEKRQMCLELYDIRTSGTEIIPNQSSESVNINSHGFRGSEITLEKPTGVFRIFMLGGSTMFGMGATSDETTIPGYTQLLFDDIELNNSIQIINAGIQDANTKTESKMIEQKIINYAPDLIIMYDGWNDLRENFDIDTTINNWKSVCKIGAEKNFDVVIILQPIAGFGNKILTEQEKHYVNTGLDYNNNLLVNNISSYQKIAERLPTLNSCTLASDMRNVFDDYLQPIYWDHGHVSDNGNSIIAKLIFEKILPLIKDDYIHDILTSKTFEPSTKIEKTTDFMQNIKNLISYYKTPIMLSNLFR